MAESGRNAARVGEDWQERLLETLKQRIPNAGYCNKCQHSSKGTGSHPVTLLAWRDDMTRIEEGFLMAVVVCDNCGHTEFFSLQKLGIQE